MKKYFNKTIFSICILLLSASFLYGCGSKEAPEASPTPAAAIPAEAPAEPEKIELGGVSVDADCTELELKDGEFSFDALMVSLGKLTSLSEISLGETSLSASELDELRSASHCELSYSVSFMGKTYPCDASSADLSGINSSSLSEAEEFLKKLPEISAVKLTSDSGENLLTPDEAIALHQSVPEAAFDYRFEFYGQTISLSDETVEYSNESMGDDTVDFLSSLLSAMPQCKRFVLDECGIDYELLAGLRDSYPDTKVVWHIHFGSHGCLTDVTRLRADPTLVRGYQLDDLKYCTEVEFIDFGHNRGITTIDFAQYMPRLKGIILSDSSLESIEPLRYCKDLQFIELCNCHNLLDISPLADCPDIRLVNISNCWSVTDASCMFGKESLERFYLPMTKVPDEQAEELIESLPNCWVTVESPGIVSGMSENYSLGWRIDEDKQRSEWYVELREIFDYHQNFYNYDYLIGKEPPMPELKYFH